jgi:DNA-binding NtrC family response regulator
MGKLSDRRILVVEDEVVIAMELQDLLAEAGCRNVLVAGSVGAALDTLAAEALDGAVLDVSVGGEAVFPVADALADKSVPYVLVTGHSVSSLPERMRDRPLMLKPYDPRNLITLLERVV